jgi:hypothetical protein
MSPPTAGLRTRLWKAFGTIALLALAARVALSLINPLLPFIIAGIVSLGLYSLLYRNRN